MRSLLKIGFALLVMAFVLIGLSFGMLRAQGLSGPANPEGRMLSNETRAVGKSISGVELTGPIDLTLRYGATPSLVVSGEQRLLGNVQTSEEGGVLRIGTRGIVLRHRRPLQAVLVLPALQSLVVNGSGDSTVDGFSGERIELQQGGSGSVKFNGRYRRVFAGLHGSGELAIDAGTSNRVEVELNGSGEMTLVGSAQDLRAEVRGSGSLDAQHLRADAVSIQQVGSGSSVVFARNAVSAAVTGSGDIEVYGNPGTRSISRTGSGSVEFTD
ncbi:MAG: head GIN domain-containing protein [Massilia sp.]